MTKDTKKTNRGFSLLELVVVVVIIGIIAAVAIPRMSRGSAGAADAALSGNLAVLRNAVDLYSVEHNGAFPTKENVSNALLKYTDSNGAIADDKDTTHIYGPYVRRIPPLPVGLRKGCTGISDTDANSVGWIYNESTGHIRANTTDSETDASGTKYSEY